MNSNTDPQGSLAEFKSVARQRWAALSKREQRLLQAAALVLLAWLAWSTLVAPALRVWREAPQRWQTIDERTRQMQALAAEAAHLRQLMQGALRKQALPQGVAAAEALKEQSLRWQPGIRTAVAGDRATLDVLGVSGEQLQAALAEARLLVGARAVQARLQVHREGSTPGVEPGSPQARASGIVGQVVLQWGAP